MCRFPTEADVDLRPGGTVRFVRESSRDESVIDERRTSDWSSGGGPRARNAPTRVTVTLEDLVGGGTRLVLVEDGFSAFAEDERGDMVAGNDRGWDERARRARGVPRSSAA